MKERKDEQVLLFYLCKELKMRVEAKIKWWFLIFGYIMDFHKQEICEQLSNSDGNFI
ncbi:hypothetical protein [Prevotella fusca]